MNGFDRYLEFQFRWSGSFYTHLFGAIQQADHKNLEKLAKGFPEEVDAYKTWARVGSDAFLSNCSQDHPLVRAVAAGKAFL